MVIGYSLTLLPKALHKLNSILQSSGVVMSVGATETAGRRWRHSCVRVCVWVGVRVSLCVCGEERRRGPRRNHASERSGVGVRLAAGERVDDVRRPEAMLDCLRLIAKNEADFGIFQPEDLVVATRDKAGDFVITHNIQDFQTDYEYKLVVIVRKSANIKSLRDLKNQNLCHPGHGYTTDWTEVEGKFFEERVVPQTCDFDLTIYENFIKSSSTFFRAACKAGPWVPDSKLDAALKMKYSNLCSLCDQPKRCSEKEKYWGRTGPLYCLTDVFGDVAWARLDDVQIHFGLSSEINGVANPDDYSFLCEDGSLQPLNNSNPCSWLDRPWPAIMAQRYAAVGIQKLIASLKGNVENKWQQAIRQLLDADRLKLVPLSTTKIPEDYLRSGFLSANSIIHCDRHVKLCTYSELTNAKCNWISEAAKANGVKPDIVCEEHDNIEKCMDDVSHGNSDAVIVESNLLKIASRKYNLISVLYEHINLASTAYNIAAVVLASSSIKSLEDLQGKRACFSQYDGTDSASLEKFSGEYGALECLRSGRGDVAFVPQKFIFNGTDTNWPASHKYKEFVLVCPSNNTKECSLSRTTPGQIMVKSDISPTKLREVKMVFEYISNQFGRHPKQNKPIFKIFAPFDGHKNILFHDETESLEDDDFHTLHGSPISYHKIIEDSIECSTASLKLSSYILLTVTLVIFLCALV
ncbi:Transferrin [Gryllus bimaculatus]|nr:Transferrin [Gryllus bimaculatus]